MTDKSIVTRFAPSPTGFLHIGGARTALFNWLFARHHGGKFLLRIEDTDRARSTPEAIDAILEGLDWLGLQPDEEPVYQFARSERHAAIAHELLEKGLAYRCYCTPEELAAMREVARAEGRRVGYDGRWRDRAPEEAPEGIPPVIRFKAPREGETVIEDRVQGTVTFKNDQLDDMVLLRADGTPTYMLSVVVDDHDMGITHVIRGDDHLVNAARQTQLYRALGWEPPVFAHIPLIHGPDGAKLSKRHGALGVEAYRDMGYLPEAMRNYLLRLGWGHGDDEIITTEQAIEWFDLDGVGRSPARFDFAKLDSLNAHYLRNISDQELLALSQAKLEEASQKPLSEHQKKAFLMLAPGLKPRAKKLTDVIENALFLVEERPLTLDPKALKLLSDDAREMLARLHGRLATIGEWDTPSLEMAIKSFAEDEGLKLGKIAQPLRAALTGRTVSPGIYDVLVALGRDESLARLADQMADDNDG